VRNGQAGDTTHIQPCPVLSYPVLYCPILSCPVLSYPVLSYPVLSCPVLYCTVLSYPVLYCPVLSCPVLSPERHQSLLILPSPHPYFLAQAIGTTCLNQYERFDTLLFTMVYPQKPMVKSRTLDLIHFDQVECGVVQCSALHSGYYVCVCAVLDFTFWRCPRIVGTHMSSD
jgi:hypothetical protein